MRAGVFFLMRTGKCDKKILKTLASEVSDAKQKYTTGEELSFDGLDRELARLELMHELQKGLQDIESGRVVSVDECFSRLKR